MEAEAEAGAEQVSGYPGLESETPFINKRSKRWGHNSTAEGLPSTCEVLDSISNITRGECETPTRNRESKQETDS